MANIPTLYVRTVSAGAATLTNVASSATTVQLLAANGSRKGVTIRNDSSAILYVKYGVTASTTSYTDQVAANTTWVMPTHAVYQGRIDGIWASANGSARITELT